MNSEYLRKFADSRFDNFQFGKEVERRKYFSTGKVTMNLVELERYIMSGKGTSFEKFLFTIFDMLEAIHRVDFNSKYYFHTFIPRARNIASLKVLVLYQGGIYSFHPLTNNIYRTKNTVFLETSHNPQLLIVSDNRVTQYYYGEFNKMLSKLNLGHALFNVEYSLHHLKALMNYKEEVYVKTDSGSFIDDPYVTLSMAIEVQLNDIGMGPRQETLSTKGFVKKNLEARPIPVLPSLFEGIEKSSFRRRSSDQRKNGDVIFNRQLPEKTLLQLLDELITLLEGIPIKLYFVLNDVENWPSGYYLLSNDILVYQSETETNYEHMQILKEYQEYTNLQGFNIWTFFTIEYSETVQNHTSLFIQMGMIMQFISVFMAGKGYAVRCLKNYDDHYIKSKTFMGDNEIIGYSSVIFPNNNNVIAIQVNSSL